MPPIYVHDNQASDLVFKAQEERLQNLRLSDSQRSLIERYRQLSVQETLNDKELDHLDYIWEKAVNDEQLAKGLGLIDELHPPCLAGENLLSEDKDLRTYLSEHVPILAEQKLQQRRGEQQALDISHSHMTLFCPDGSGIVRLDLEIRDFVEIDDEQVCSRCHARFSEHKKWFQSKNCSPASS